METLYFEGDRAQDSKRPHSLGKSIEWKLLDGNELFSFTIDGPHSLGKSIEWKLHPQLVRRSIDWCVPTRWGNQLNGNPGYTCKARSCDQSRVPTRWGNQLNGNQDSRQRLTRRPVVPTRWGNQLNGNECKKRSHSFK